MAIQLLDNCSMDANDMDSMASRGYPPEMVVEYAVNPTEN